MKYYDYEINPEFVSGSRINWKTTGNGEYIFGSKRGSLYFIKRNINLRFPTKDDSKMVYDKKKAATDAAMEKQKSLRRQMKDLSWKTDHIVVEEDNFGDYENMFVTVSAFIPDILPGNFDYSVLSFTEYMDLVKEFANILYKIHSRNVIHGDLKEGNVPVLKKGGKYIPYLIDFDTSYLATAIPTWESIGGTDGYQSPEIMLYFFEEDEGDSSTITPATDIFTMALVMHRWWTGRFPGVESAGCAVGAAVYGDEEISIDRKFDIKIGDNCGATLMSLINWMLTKDPMKRPTAFEVMNVLFDRIEVPDEFHVGKDDKPFDKEVWARHKLVAELYSVDQLKSKGIKSLKRQNVGGAKGLKYEVVMKDGKSSILSIDEMINSGYAKRIPAFLEAPWDEHNIEFISPEEISKKGYARITRLSSSRDKRYLITQISGFEFNDNYKWLLKEGLAKTKTIAPDYVPVTGDKPWPEHGVMFVPEAMVRFGIVKISRVELGCEHRYKVEYKDKVSNNVNGNNLRLMGVIK